MRARLIGGLPADLVGSLTGLTQGHFPVHAKARYADDLAEQQAHARDRQGPQRRDPGRERDQPAAASTSSPRPARPVIAVQDGKIVEHRPQRAPRPLHQAARRLRQHLHVRAPQVGRRPPTRCPSRQTSRKAARSPRSSTLPQEGPAADAGRQRGHAAAPQGRRGAQARRAAARLDAAGRRPPQGRRSPRSACSPTRSARRPSSTAAQEQILNSRRRTGTRRSRATSPRSSASTATTSRSSRLPRSARRSSPARSSAASAARRRRVAPHVLLRDPPGRPRRAAHRPEADPRRLEAARVDRDLPRRRQEPVLRPRRQGPDDRPGPADEQGGAAAPRARPTRASTIYDCGRRDIAAGADRPPRARHARVPRRLGPEADGHRAEVRPQPPHDVGQRLRALDRRRRRHRRRSTGSRSSATRARARSPTSRSAAC